MAFPLSITFIPIPLPLTFIPPLFVNVPFVPTPIPFLSTIIVPLFSAVAVALFIFIPFDWYPEYAPSVVPDTLIIP